MSIWGNGDIPRFNSLSSAPSAASYGVGPAWIGGVQYWSDGVVYHNAAQQNNFFRDTSVTEKILCDWSGNLDISSWTTTGSTVAEVTPSQFPVAAPSFVGRGKFISVLPAAGSGQVNLLSPTFTAVSLANAGSIVAVRVPVYFPDWRYNASTTGERLSVDLGTISNYTDRISFNSAATSSNADQFQGWNDIIVPICDSAMPSIVNGSAVSVSGAGTTSSIICIRLQVKRYDVNDARPIIIGPITYGYKVKPKVCLTFDDGQASIYTTAYPALKKRGFPATFFTIGNQVSTGDGVNIVSPAQLHTMQDNGWCIANHSWSHINQVLDNATDAEKEADITTHYEWLKSNGFNGYDIFAWPGGAVYNASKSVLRKLGTKIGCTYTSSSTGAVALLPPVLQDGTRYVVQRWPLEGTTARVTTTSLTVLDFCIANGIHVIFNCHAVTSSATSGTNTNTTEYNTFLDGLLARVRAGQCEVVTLRTLADNGKYE